MLQKDKWIQLQKNGYFPGVEENIIRIENDIKDIDDKRHNLFLEWSGILDMPIDCRDKTVLEIGHGGGWYLAQALTKGAALAIGIEIESLINSKADAALKHFNFKNFILYEADETCLKIVKEKNVDIIYCITVFQHTHPDITRTYLETAKDVLSPTGMIYCQFLMNDVNNSKNPLSGEGVVRYSMKDITDLSNSLGLKIVKQGQLNYPNPHQDYWGIFALQY